MISFNELVLRYHENGYNNNMMMTSSPSLVNVMDGADGADDDSTVRSSESHKEAERRRRERINSHLSTLRTLLPTSPANTGKAMLLASVVQRVKELKRRADDEVARRLDGELFPGEVDEARLMNCQEGKVMKATLCCEDRPGLSRDLSHAIESVRVKAVRVEMVAVGGRIKIVVVMKWTGGGGGEEGEVKILKAALTAVVENRFSGFRTKRDRVYGSVSSLRRSQSASLSEF